MTSRLDFVGENCFSCGDVHTLLMGLTWERNDFFSTFSKKLHFCVLFFTLIFPMYHFFVRFLCFSYLKNVRRTPPSMKNGFSRIAPLIHGYLTAVRLCVMKSDCRFANESIIVISFQVPQCFPVFRNLNGIREVTTQRIRCLKSVYTCLGYIWPTNTQMLT